MDSEASKKPTIPWYESNLVWGPISLGVGILLTVVAAMKHDLRWLLWFALPCLLFASWSAAKYASRAWLRWLIMGVCMLVLCGGLYATGVWLGSPEESSRTKDQREEPKLSVQPESPRKETVSAALPVPNARPLKEPSHIKSNPKTSAARASGSSPPITLQNSPGSAVSINQQGGITAGIVNLGPPPPPPLEIKWRVSDTTGSSEKPHYETQVTITVNVKMSPVAVGILCDAPVETSHMGNKNGLAASNVHQFSEGNTAFIYFEGSALTPYDELYVTLQASQPFSVLAVKPALIKGLND